jgi:hypothetical protein
MDNLNSNLPWELFAIAAAILLLYLIYHVTRPIEIEDDLFGGLDPNDLFRDKSARFYRDEEGRLHMLPPDPEKENKGA